MLIHAHPLAAGALVRAVPRLGVCHAFRLYTRARILYVPCVPRDLHTVWLTCARRMSDADVS